MKTLLYICGLLFVWLVVTGEISVNAQSPSITVAIDCNLVVSPSHPTAYLPSVRLNAGEQVVVLGIDMNGAWLLVLHQNTLGWIPSVFSNTAIATLDLTVIDQNLSDTCSTYLGTTIIPQETWLNNTNGPVIVQGIIYHPEPRSRLEDPSIAATIDGPGSVSASVINHVMLLPVAGEIFQFTFTLEGLRPESQVGFKFMGLNTKTLSFQAAFYRNDCSGYDPTQIVQPETEDVSNPAQVLATPIVVTTVPSKLLPGDVVFASKRDGNSHVYIMYRDGYAQYKLTEGHWNDENPAWSPVAQEIAFQSDRTGNFDIYVVSINGNNLRRLTQGSTDDLLPAWSPDGQRIAFVSLRDSNPDIYTVKIDGTDFQRLTNHPSGDWRPSYSPDGQRIAFTSTRTGCNEIYVMDSDGNALRQLTFNSGDNRDPAWSPDGKWIAFISLKDGNFEIYVMREDGSDQRRLTNNPGEDRHPCFLPDGQHIGFHSDRLGPYALFLMNTDGSDQTVLPFNPVGDFQPHWK